MSSGIITNKCFPPANKCVNCKRKDHDHRPARVGDTSREYKRCTGCRLMTYCDQDCQREHWRRIHKHHCGFLGGRKQANYSEHNPRTCVLCVESRNSSPGEITSMNSPKIHCYIQEAITWTEEGVARFFNFHSEGRTCSCSLTSPWPGFLPSSFGEISGHYVGGGQHEMLAHALKLSVAIEKKAQNKNVKEEAKRVLLNLVCGRVTIWADLLISGKGSITLNSEVITLGMNSLKRYLGPSNPWWIALMFSMDVLNTMEIQSTLPTTIKSDFMEKHKDDQRFKTLKELLKHDQSQYKNIVFASTNNLLTQFKVWPKVVDNSLVVLLPSGLHCKICKDPVEGKFSLKGLGQHYPFWLQQIGENGSCEVYCSLLKNPNCVREGIIKDVRATIENDKDQWKAYTEEWSLFLKLSRICDECGRRSLSSHRCAACLAAQYCSSQCQMEDLEFHKTVCAKWAQDQSKTLGSSKEQKKHWKSLVDKIQNQ